MQITVEQLKLILGYKKINLINRLINPINECLQKYEINTPLRINHFLAQVIHESGCFQYFEEIASGKAYEGRKDLGNVNEGDGVKYKGRGLIQVTGRANYTQISKDLNENFVVNPKLLATDKYAVMSAGWYWGLKKLNIWADKDDVTTITKRINGGLNGFADRKMWLDKCKNVIK